MAVERRLRLTLAWGLAAAAIVLLAGAHQRSYAQAKADQRGGAAGKQDSKTQAATAVERKTKPVRQHRTRKRGSAIPEPTVELKPGEVPKITFESSVFDFGRVKAGTRIQHDFVFTNTGNGALEILKAKAG